MPKRGVLFALMMASLAMLVFVVGFICWQLGLALWAALIYRLAGIALLLAFCGLSLLGVWSLSRALVQTILAYFSAEARALRRLLSLRIRRDESRNRLLAQARQLRFWARIKRQRLADRDDKRQLRALFRAIDDELKAAKAQFGARRCQLLRKALRQHLKQADVHAMLALREQCTCR